MASAIGGLLCCEQCSSPYAVLDTGDDTKKHLRCSSCGHSEDVWVTAADTVTKWTVIDPSGKVRAFDSPDALVTALTADGTAKPPANPFPFSEESSPASTPPESLQDVPLALVPSLKAEDALDDDEDAEPISMRDVAEEGHEPVSLRDLEVAAEKKDEEDALDSDDLIEAKSEPKPALAPPPTVEARTAPTLEERLAAEAAAPSVATAWSPAPSKRPSSIKTPLPPKAGQLATLPPRALAMSVPPTITVSDRPPSVRPTAQDAAKKAPAKTLPPAPAESSGSRWTIPAVLAVVALGVWYFAIHKTDDANASRPAPTATTTTPTTAPTATTTTATTSTATPATSTIELSPSASASGAPIALHSGGGGAGLGFNLAETLDRASAARKKGDYAAAKELYTHALSLSPGNAEALAGMGNVAHAQGDLPGAKASFQQALTTSPGYGPALLGLADTEWESGDHTTATLHYKEIVGSQGMSAPARAKERASGGGETAPSATAPSATAPTTTAEPTATAAPTTAPATTTEAPAP